MFHTMLRCQARKREGASLCVNEDMGGNAKGREGDHSLSFMAAPYPTATARTTTAPATESGKPCMVGKQNKRSGRARSEPSEQRVKKTHAVLACLAGSAGHVLTA